MHPLAFASLFLSLWLSPTVGLRDGPWIETYPGGISFGGRLNFSACIHTSESISTSRLILEYGSSRYVFSPRQTESPDGYSLTAEEATVSQTPFPFSSGKYWWEADFPSGEILASPVQTFFYSDSRFSWNRSEINKIILYSIGLAPDATGDIADLTLLSLGTVSAEWETPIPDSITLAVYPNQADFQSALGSRVRGWEGAVSSPEERVIIVAAAPGAEGRKTLAVLIPHEVTHVLLGAKWGAAYSSLPLWLAEGLASGYEMEPRPKAEQALMEAADAGTLISIRALCGVFPSMEGPALLAYAESKSFVTYLKGTYGLPAMRNAAAAYASGADCGRGIEDAIGKPLEDLESDWRVTLTGKSSWIPLPWAFVLAGAGLLGGLWILHYGVGRRRRVVVAEKGREE
jgi:hypothetical protein